MLTSQFQAPFGFTADHYYYEVFGEPNEDDVFGRVVAEPNPQMYGLDRKVVSSFPWKKMTLKYSGFWNIQG